MRLFDNLHDYQRKYPGKILFRFKVNGQWKDWKVEEVIEMARLLAKSLMAAGLKKDDKVGLIIGKGKNNR